ncbi:MAG: hypothetical protein K0U68_03340 [Gammaproteobacteria bacterium]|nr:hypothetical protein [Gammaproteobacteria bacterium]
MSTICGLFHRKSGEIDRSLEKMLSAMATNGLADGTQWAQGSVGLAQGESIATESQHHTLPGYDNLTQLAITADARLDNRATLGDTFGYNSSELNKLTDSQLVLRAFRRWGKDCPQHLLGDFAFVIWEPQTKLLFCARDHIGVKPFYYSLTPEQFTFASDINGILAAPGVSDNLDESYIASSLIDKFFAPKDRTFYQTISKLPPGHTLAVQPDTIKLEQYWFPERAPSVCYRTDADYEAAFLELYTRAVHDRLRTQHPIGVHLSGGLDSSSIAVLAARELKRCGKPSPPAFCWLPPPTKKNCAELEYALIQSVCTQERLQAHYLFPSPEDIVATFRKDVTREPTVGTLLNEEVVQQQASAQGVRVMLSGWGGDEGVSNNGHGYFSELLLNGHWRQLYREGKLNSSHAWKVILLGAVLPILHPKAPNVVTKLRNGKSPFADRSFINPGFAQRVKVSRRKSYRATSIRQTQLQLLENGHITFRMEAWAASGRQHNIVYRYPLLDRRVLEFALGLPAEQFRLGGIRRRLMRNALQHLLPSEVCWNVSKNDLIRCNALLEVVSLALPKIKNTLITDQASLNRDSYIDIPRLMEQLDTDTFMANPRLGNIRPALQLLDF